MSRPVPKNLQLLYDSIGPKAAARMHEGHSFEIDGVEFVTGYVPESTADRFYVVKSAELLALYDEFLDARRPRRIFELGIAEGGSTAMLALRPDLEMLVAIDNEEHRLPALDDFIAQRGLGDRVHAYYAIDQSDAATMGEIADRHFPESTIEMVIDDASHVYEFTKASFDVLFPRLAPGGWYLIEDWSQRLKAAEGMIRAAIEKQGEAETLAGLRKAKPNPPATGPTPLERIGFEWVAAMGAWPGGIDRIEMNDLFIACRRGPAPLDATSFRLDDLARAEAFVGLLRPIRSES